MRVAIVHHHLRRGGVTEVIRRATATLAPDGVRVVVLSGESPEVELHPLVEHRLIAELGYASGRGIPRVETLETELRRAAEGPLGGAPEVWHFHNHSLGKNPAVTLLVTLLAEAGERLLLQIHDFAEDGRPDLHRRLVEWLRDGDSPAPLYPGGPHVGYATLNDRDREVLARAGVDDGRLFLLANPVAAPPESPSDPAPLELAAGRRLFLYPTRGIRRKNLGELLAWAAAAEEGDVFATTLLPKTAADVAVHERWERLVAELSLPVELGVGTRTERPFFDILAAAHRVVTTSVAEGFGMCFLEPWLAGRRLLGRNLPEITRDFSSVGLDLGGLYDRLLVPIEWIDRPKLVERHLRALERSMESYGRRLEPSMRERAIETLIDRGRVDFARLDEDLQEQVIRRLRLDRDLAGALRPRRLEPRDGDDRVVEANRQLILERFGLESYGERLRSIYRQLRDAQPGSVDQLDGDAILDAFLAPERFLLLRS